MEERANRRTHYFGEEKAVKYNSESQKISPSDVCFTYFTLSLILIPSSLCLIVVICLNEYFAWWLKIILSILYIITLYASLYNLFKCSQTDPGIIPSISLDSKLPETNRKKPKSNIDYYACY